MNALALFGLQAVEIPYVIGFVVGVAVTCLIRAFVVLYRGVIEIRDRGRDD